MPSDPILQALSVHKAKPPCFQARWLALAGRLMLERLAPEPLQALLHAEPSSLLFYREEKMMGEQRREEKQAEPRASLIKRLRKQLQPL